MRKRRIILGMLLISCVFGIFLGSSKTMISNAKENKINRKQIIKTVDDLTDWMAMSFFNDSKWKYQSSWKNQKLDAATKKKIVETVMYFEKTNNGRKLSNRLFGQNVAKKYTSFKGDWGDIIIESRIQNIIVKKNELTVWATISYNQICGKYSVVRQKIGDVKLGFHISKKQYYLKSVCTKVKSEATKQAGKYPLYEIKIDRIQRNGENVTVVGDARVPIDPQKTAKQRKQLKKGKLTMLGRTWIVKRVKEKYAMTKYYLYKNKHAKKYNYVLQEDTPWLNYLLYFFGDPEGRRVYNDAGKVYMQIGAEAFEDSGGETAYQKFINGESWKDKWIPMEVNKNQVTTVEPNGAKE